MNASPHTHRLATTVGLVAVVATLAVPVSLAGGPSPALVARPTSATPDPAVTGPKSVQTPEASASSQGLDPAIAHAIAAHKSAQALDTSAPSQGLDPALANAIAVHRGITATPSSVPGDGFQWGSFGIAAALVMTLLLLVTFVGRAACHGLDKRRGSFTAT